VKYLGRRDARGLWGIKHTRRPVDAMVAAAKNATTSGIILPLVRLSISQDGVSLIEITPHKVIFRFFKQLPKKPYTFIHSIEFHSVLARQLSFLRLINHIIDFCFQRDRNSNTPLAFYPIDTISYGVQVSCSRGIFILGRRFFLRYRHVTNETFFLFAGLGLHEGFFDDCGARNVRAAGPTPFRVSRFCVRQPQPRPPPHLRTGRGLHRVLKVGARRHRGHSRGGGQKGAQVRHRPEDAGANREGVADPRRRRF